MSAHEHASTDRVSRSGGGAQIYDRGYRRYDGERRSVRGSVFTLYLASLQRVLGLRRGAKAKIIPVAAECDQHSKFPHEVFKEAHRLGLLQGAIVGIGNAPTALIELVRLIREEGLRPALVIGMPVGFVSAAESKALMAEVAEVPWIVIRGRKGGSTLVVAALHALLALAEAAERAPA